MTNLFILFNFLIFNLLMAMLHMLSFYPHMLRISYSIFLFSISLTFLFGTFLVESTKLELKRISKVHTS